MSEEPKQREDEVVDQNATRPSVDQADTKYRAVVGAAKIRDAYRKLQEDIERQIQQGRSLFPVIDLGETEAKLRRDFEKDRSNAAEHIDRVAQSQIALDRRIIQFKKDPELYQLTYAPSMVLDRLAGKISVQADPADTLQALEAEKVRLGILKEEVQNALPKQGKKGPKAKDKDESTTSQRGLKPIMWFKSDAAFGKVFEALRDRGIIECKPREFAALFIDTNGDKMKTPSGGNQTLGRITRDAGVDDAIRIIKSLKE